MLQIIAIEEECADLEIIRTLFREYQQELNEDLCFQSFEAEVANPLKKYGAPEGSLLIARWDHEVGGCIALAPLKIAGSDRYNCEMKRLYVRPAYRQFGIGRALVNKIIILAK